MNQEEAERNFGFAESLFVDGSAQEALDILDSVSRSYPHQKNVLQAQARCLVALGRAEEAKALCETLIRDFDSDRAKTLLRTLDNPAASADPFTTKNEMKDPALAVRKSFPVAWILGLAIAVSAIVAWILYQGKEEEKTSAAAPPMKDESATLREREELFRTQMQSLHATGGQVIPNHLWSLTAINGYPDWRPGIYRNVLCAGLITNIQTGELPRTVDVYIPKAYDGGTLRNFPLVMISMPKINPGFIGLEPWAEERGVILIANNSNRNGPAENNLLAQDASFKLMTQSSLRAHPKRKAAIGMSGGAQSSWLAVHSRPSEFSGVVMMGQAGYREFPIAPRLKVGYVHGETDHNREYIESLIGVLQRQGNPVRYMIIPGGHIMGPVLERTKMLDWVLGFE